MPQETTTFVTYNEGLEAKHLHLGNLVHDYTNPNALDPFVEKGYNDIAEAPPSWATSTALKNFALTLGKTGDRIQVAAAAKTTKIEIKDPASFFTSITLTSAPAKKWLSAHLSAADALAHSSHAKHVPPQLYILTSLVLMTHATWSSLKSSVHAAAFVPGTQAPFDPTGVSAIRRLSVSEGVRPTFTLEGKEEEVPEGMEGGKKIEGAEVLETGKYPGMRAWGAKWRAVEIKIVEGEKGGNNAIPLDGRRVALVRLGEEVKGGGKGEDLDDEYWDAFLDKTEEV